jgi:hypothetical protein
MYQLRVVANFDVVVVVVVVGIQKNHRTKKLQATISYSFVCV